MNGPSAETEAPTSSGPLEIARLAGRLVRFVTSSALRAGLIVAEGRVLGPSDARRAVHVRAWAGRLLRSLGVHLGLDGPVSAAQGGGATLVVCNHRSILDIPIVLSVSGGHMLSRGDVRAWPVFGKIAEVAGTIFVDRDDSESGQRAVRRIRDLLRNGDTVCLFPEGTTYGGDEVRPFHLGAFSAAVRTKARVVPMGVAYADEACVYGDETLTAHVQRVAARPVTLAALAVGDAYDARDLRTDDLCKRAHADVQSLVRRARALLSSDALGERFRG